MLYVKIINYDGIMNSIVLRSNMDLLWIAY